MEKLSVDWESLVSDLHVYEANCLKVYDADTITVNIDLGFKMHLAKQKIRLYGINAPEMRGPERAKGTISRDALRERILGKTIHLRTVKKKLKGKYGRWLGIIYMENGENINQWLVDEGYARIQHYG